MMLVPLLPFIILLAAGGATDIYFGRADDAKKPAEVTSQDIFNEIPEYKKIREKELTKDDAQYWVLLNKANEKFNEAVKKSAESGKYDVVAEKGKHKFDSTPADLTKKVIEALNK